MKNAHEELGERIYRNLLVSKNLDHNKWLINILKTILQPTVLEPNTTLSAIKITLCGVLMIYLKSSLYVNKHLRSLPTSEQSLSINVSWLHNESGLRVAQKHMKALIKFAQELIKPPSMFHSKDRSRH